MIQEVGREEAVRGEGQIIKFLKEADAGCRSTRGDKIILC